MSKPTRFPVGSFINTELGDFYVTAEGKRSRFITERVRDSWSPQRIILATETATAGYRITSKMMFRSGSLIKNIADGKLYLIEGSHRRWITSPDAVTRLNIDVTTALVVSDEEINLHEEGENLN